MISKLLIFCRPQSGIENVFFNLFSLFFYECEWLNEPPDCRCPPSVHCRAFDFDIVLLRQILKLSGILRLGFRDYHKLGNLDLGWQSLYTVNKLFLHISAPRKTHSHLSSSPPQNISLLNHLFKKKSLHLRPRCLSLSSAKTEGNFGNVPLWIKCSPVNKNKWLIIDLRICPSFTHTFSRINTLLAHWMVMKCRMNGRRFGPGWSKSLLSLICHFIFILHQRIIGCRLFPSLERKPSRCVPVLE